MVRAKRMIYEGMKRRFKYTPEQRARKMIYLGLKKNMTRPRGWAVFNDPANKEVFKLIYAHFKKNMTRRSAK